MFAVAFDLDTNNTELHHPKSSLRLTPISAHIEVYGFEWKQGSVYTTGIEDMANLVDALDALKTLPWFPASVRDIWAFRIQQWSDFTPRTKH